MRVLIHAVSVQKTGGSSRHLARFIPTLSRDFPEDEYLLCLKAEFAADHIVKQIERLIAPDAGGGSGY